MRPSASVAHFVLRLTHAFGSDPRHRLPPAPMRPGLTMITAAGALAIVVAAFHSVLGEVLIFRHLRSGGLVPNANAPPLRERHVRILWASWHVLSVFGLALAAFLLRLGRDDHGELTVAFVRQTVVIAMLLGAALVLIGTKGRHPGWIGLSAVAALVWLA